MIDHNHNNKAESYVSYFLFSFSHKGFFSSTSRLHPTQHSYHVSGDESPCFTTENLPRVSHCPTTTGKGEGPGLQVSGVINKPGEGQRYCPDPRLSKPAGSAVAWHPARGTHPGFTRGRSASHASVAEASRCPIAVL